MNLRKLIWRKRSQIQKTTDFMELHVNFWDRQNDSLQIAVGTLLRREPTETGHKGRLCIFIWWWMLERMHMLDRVMLKHQSVSLRFVLFTAGKYLIF